MHSCHGAEHAGTCSCLCCVHSYLKDRDLDWGYWPLDGQQGPSRAQGSEETYGLLNTTWDGWAYLPLLQQLQAIM